MKTKQIFLFVALLVSSITFSQDYIMGTDTGTITTCSGTFYDSGGPSGLYSIDEDYTLTFCPDLVTNPGSVIRVEFTQFETQGPDTACTDPLTAYHGNSVATAIDNQAYCDLLSPFTIQSISPDGCITFVFTSNNTSQKIGWAANITCYVPCTPPVANLVDESTLDLCSTTSLNPGNTTVSFDATPSTTVAGTTITTYEWVWGDGTIDTTNTPTNTHIYPGDGVYQMSLAVRSDDVGDDPLGCLSPPKVKLIRIMPPPSYAGSGASVVGANTPVTTLDVDCGHSVDLIGVVTSQTNVQASPSLNAPPIGLPDGLGQVFNSPLDFSGFFPAGDTMTPGCYPTVNFDIEHSYSGDLTIDLVAPSGEIVRLYDQEGGGTHFGTCANQADDEVPGCTAAYSVVSTGGVAWGGADIPSTDPDIVNCAPIYAGACEGGTYYDSTTYTSTNPFTAFDGAQMNGVWTLRITDNLSIDDGVLTSWSLVFPGSCFGSIEHVTPDLTISDNTTSPSGMWVHTGAGPALPAFTAQTATSTVVNDPGPDGCPAGETCEGDQITNDITVGPFDVGGQTYTYTYVVTDEFGCEHQQDIIINVLDNCTECTLDLDSAVGTDAQNICEGDSITDITYLAGNEVVDVVVDAGLPAGVTGSYNAATSIFTITGTPTVTGTFNYTVTTVGCLNADVATQQGTIVVSVIPVANAVPNLRLCDTDNNGSESFDFATQTVAVLGGQTGMTVSYYDSQVNADAGTATGLITSPYVNTTDPETIFIRVENDANTTCFATISFTIEIDASPVANAVANPEMRLCDVGADGTELYDLVAEFEAEVVGTQTNTTVTYYDENNVVIATPNAYAGTLAQEIITIEVDFNDAANVCVVATTTVTIFLDAIPVANAIPNLRLCDTDNNGSESFDFATQTVAVLGGQTGMTVSYYDSQVNADAGTATGLITSPYVNTTDPETIFIRVENDANTTCFATISFTIEIDASPVANAVANPEMRLCDVGADGTELYDLVAEFEAEVVGTQTNTTVTYYDENNVVIATPNAYAGTLAQEIITIEVDFNDAANVCVVATTTVTIFLDPLPTLPTNPAAFLYQECDTDVIDGFATFDEFANQTDLIIGANNYIVTYHLTLGDAQGNTGVITDGYVNTTPTVQVIGVRIEDAITGCINTMEITLEVVAAPQSFPFTNPIVYCDTDNDTFGYFDLNTIVADLTGGIAGVNVLFYETQAEADQGVGAIDTSVLYENVDTDGDGIGATQTIYAQLSVSGLACYTLVPINLLVINSPVLPSEELTYAQCEEMPDITDGIVIFDLPSYEQTTLYAEIIAAGGDTSEYTATYYTALFASGNPDPASLIGNPFAYENTSTPDQVIYVVVTHTGSVTVPATGCSTIKAITLHVDLLPTAEYTQIEVCDDNLENEVSDGKIIFNLTDYISIITGGTTGVNVEFYTTAIAAEAGLGAATLPIIEFIATPTAYENAINPQAIFARVHNPISDCYAVAIVNLHVNPNPTPLNNQEIIDTLGNGGVMEECDGNVDGSGAISEQVAEFDLTQWEIAILNGESGVSAAYYTSVDDAATGTNPIENPATYTNIVNPQTIYVSVINDGFGINPITNGTGCYTIVEFQLYVPVPEVDVVADKNVICVDENGVPLTNTTLPVLTATAGPAATAAYNYQWALNGVDIAGATNQTLAVTLPGDYTVTVSGPTNLDCINISQPVTIEVSGVPQGFDANVTTNAFSDSHEIVATATSTIPGIIFWYSLDGAEPTMDGTFTNVSPGIHIVTISDGENCWSTDETVAIIDYPHFFTPNGDGINDTWAIIGQEGIPISQIYIFDRFGKLLSQLDPDGEGWDGTYNGSQMPASDYWFKIIYIEGADSTQKELKAHFSLKR